MKAIEVITLTELTPFITVKAVHLLRTAVNATGSHLSHRHILLYLYNWFLGYSLYNWCLFFPTAPSKVNLNVKTTTSLPWLLNLSDFLNYHRHLLLFNYLYYGFLWHILHNRLFHLRYLLIFYYLHHGLLWQSLHAWLLYLNFLVHWWNLLLFNFLAHHRHLLFFNYLDHCWYLLLINFLGHHRNLLFFNFYFIFLLFFNFFFLCHHRYLLLINFLRHHGNLLLFSFLFLFIFLRLFNFFFLGHHRYLLLFNLRVVAFFFVWHFKFYYY